MPAAGETVLHASAVAFAGRGLLILGRAGQGKSTLALEMMSRGAGLIADDRTILTRHGNEVILSCPDAILGAIEARGLGLLAADPAPATPLAAAVNLDIAVQDRLPKIADFSVLGCSVPLFPGPLTPYLASRMLQFLKAGLRADL